MATSSHAAVPSLADDRRRKLWSDVLFVLTAACIVGSIFISLRGLWPPPSLRDLDRGTMTTPQ